MLSRGKINQYGIEKISMKKILFSSLVCLLVGLLTTNFIGNKNIGFLIAFPILIFTANYLYNCSSDHIYFSLLIFIVAHFTTYMNNQGGLWLILFFFTFVINYKKFEIKLKNQNKIQRIFLIILIVSNLAGLMFKNPMSILIKAQSFIVFITLICTYLYFSNLKLTNSHLKSLLLVWASLIILCFIVALNQKYLFIVSPQNAFLPVRTNDEFVAYSTNRASSIINDYELFAEFSVLSLIIFLSYYFSNNDYNINKRFNLIIILLCLLNILLSGTRSAIMISILAVIIIMMKLMLTRKVRHMLSLLGLIIIVVIFSLFLGNKIGLDVITERFNEIDKISSKGIVSGDDLNRNTVYSLGYSRIENGTWWLGYGYGIVESNRNAWFTNPKFEYPDYHSLYLSLPMIFGWLGSFAFILLILSTMVKLITEHIKRNLNSSHNSIIFGFGLLLFAFLIHEYKISILREVNYVMLFFIWLGLSNSIVKLPKNQSIYS
jgi:hypothetical protein